MQPQAVLIVQPGVDFGAMLTLTSKLLGYSPAAVADQAKRPIGNAEKFLLCLAAFDSEGSDAAFATKYLPHAHFTVLGACDERDLSPIACCASEMSFVSTETTQRGISAFMLSGNLRDWREAIIAGTDPSCSDLVRHFYNSALRQFEKAGLAKVWSECERKTVNNQLAVIKR